MGGCSSNQNWGQENSDVSEKVRTKLIEALAKRQCKGEFSTNKFLLLGTSDSGMHFFLNR